MDSTAKLGRVLGVAAIIAGAGIILVTALTAASNLVTGFWGFTTVITGACAVMMANRQGTHQADTSRSSDDAFR